MPKNEILKFGEIYFAKHKFHSIKKSILLKLILFVQQYQTNIQLMKYCKHFIGYANHSTLYINLPKLKGTLTIFEKVKYVSFILEEKQR